MQRRGLTFEGLIIALVIVLGTACLPLLLCSDQNRYMSIETHDVLVPLDGQPEFVSVGSILWGKYEIKLDIDKDHRATGTMSDGTTTYPLSGNEAASMIIRLNWLDGYRAESEKWFAGGGKYTETEPPSKRAD